MKKETFVRENQLTMNYKLLKAAAFVLDGSQMYLEGERWNVALCCSLPVEIYSFAPFHVHSNVLLNLILLSEKAVFMTFQWDVAKRSSLSNRDGWFRRLIRDFHGWQGNE